MGIGKAPKTSSKVEENLNLYNMDEKKLAEDAENSTVESAAEDATPTNYEDLMRQAADIKGRGDLGARISLARQVAYMLSEKDPAAMPAEELLDAAEILNSLSSIGGRSGRVAESLKPAFEQQERFNKVLDERIEKVALESGGEIITPEMGRRRIDELEGQGWERVDAKDKTILLKPGTPAADEMKKWRQKLDTWELKRKAA